MYNKIIMIGNLTKEPELRYSASGTAITSFTLAQNSKYGETEETLFIKVTVFGKQAGSCGEYLNKGSRVLVDGRLKEEKWEYEGKEQRRMGIIANTIRFLPSKKSADKSEYTPPEEGDLEPF